MNRREMIKVGSAVVLGGLSSNAAEAAQTKRVSSKDVERWDVFEAAFNGNSSGNPFIDVWLKAHFRKGNREIVTDGFYDGNGVYKLRFMPDEVGSWDFV